MYRLSSIGDVVLGLGLLLFHLVLMLFLGHLDLALQGLPSPSLRLSGPIDNR